MFTKENLQVGAFYGRSDDENILYRLEDIKGDKVFVTEITDEAEIPKEFPVGKFLLTAIGVEVGEGIDPTALDQSDLDELESSTKVDLDLTDVEPTKEEDAENDSAE